MMSNDIDNGRANGHVWSGETELDRELKADGFPPSSKSSLTHLGSPPPGRKLSKGSDNLGHDASDSASTEHPADRDPEKQEGEAGHPVNPKIDPSAFPDGGIEAWTVVFAQGICSAIGAGALFYPAVNSISTWFFKRRALALGISASGSSVGGVIYPIMVARLVPQVGFAWAMRICAFLILGLCVIINLTVKSRLPPQPRPFKFKEFLTPFTEMPFLLTTAGAWLSFFGLYLPFTFIVSFARHYGMSPHLAGYLVSILNASSTFGRILPGHAADLFGRFNAMIITCVLNVVMVLALWLPARGNIPVLLFTAFFGFTSGAFVSLGPALVAQISDVRQIGVRTGAMFAVCSIASLTGNPIGGALVGDIEQPTFWRMQLFTGIVMAAGTVAFVLARLKVTGMKLMTKF
ncbi:hypothetical protein RJZ90_001997 [Blastomyces dermatitidis]